MNESITEGQKMQIERFAVDGTRKAIKDLDKDGLQKLIENGNKLQSRIVTAVQELSVNQYADVGRGYPPDYRPNSITEQVDILRRFFPGIGNAREELAEGTLPPGAEGWFAIPRWKKIATTYEKAVQIAFTKLVEAYPFYDGMSLTASKENCYRIRQSEESLRTFVLIEEQQRDQDILIIPAQFGIRHRGHSTREVLAAMPVGEFGLGTFAVAMMLLANPGRFKYFKKCLNIKCVGDELARLEPDYLKDSYTRLLRDWLDTPHFQYGEELGKLNFGSSRVNASSDYFGAASGFLPKP